MTVATLKDLETGEPRPLDRRVLLDALEAGPWAWCGSRAFIERARALCPGGPRPVEPGETIVLGVTPVSASIFRLLPPPARVSPPPNRELPLGQAACDALAAAAEALPGGLPLLWSRLPSADEASVRPTCWATMARPGVAIAGPPVVLDGLSCGLSFFLSLASRALRRPITHTVAASAEIRGGGVLAPVDGLDAKIRVLLAWAPCVRTLLVAGGQSEEAAAIVDGLGAAAVLHVVGVERARDALAWAIGTDAELDNHLVSLCATPIGLEDTVQDLFQVCIDGARKLSDWAPIQAAATLLESRLHARLDAALRARLQYVACVAHRHTTLRQAPPPLPSNTAWITGLPKTHQPSVLAAYAQHAADYAVPPPAQVVALIASLSPRRAVGATERELDLMGAYGRLLAVDGHARQAFALQMEIAAEHGRLGNWTNTTYQVSEAFRLAGGARRRRPVRGGRRVPGAHGQSRWARSEGRGDGLRPGGPRARACPRRSSATACGRRGAHCAVARPAESSAMGSVSHDGRHRPGWRWARSAPGGARRGATGRTPARRAQRGARGAR